MKITNKLTRKASYFLLLPLAAFMFSCGGSASADGNSGNSLTDAAKGLSNKTKKMANDAGDMAKDAGNRVKGAGGEMADGMKKAGEGMADGMKKAGEGMADGMKKTGEGMADGMKKAGEGMADKAMDAGSKMKDKAMDAGSKMKDKMADTGSKAMDKASGMKDKMVDSGSKAMDKASGMKNKVKNATSRPIASQPSSHSSSMAKSTTTMKDKLGATKDKMMPKKEMADKAMGVDHQAFDALLRKHVSSSGVVDYTGFKSDMSALNSYVSQLSQNPVESSSSKNEQLAYWINVYNANTIKLILDNYPVSSIKDINGGKPWDKSWIKIGSKTYSLNNIENDIIRPTFKEPRIHFAVNCAAKSCPPMHNRAWTAANLISTFETKTKEFINNSSYNQISSSGAKISSIFDWYGGDFGDVTAFINKYSNTKISSGSKLSYLDYDWKLNGK